MRAAILSRRLAPSFSPIAESYSTTFDATENPLAEDGLWLLGATNGLDWSDFRTQNGFAHGKQSLAAHGNNQTGGYNDSVALRRPRPGRVWHPDMDVRGRIKIVSRTGWAGFRECQLLTRATMRGNWLTCYEFIYSVVGGTTYYQIVQFMGLLSLTNVDGRWISRANASATGVNDGTYCKVTSIGDMHRMYTSPDNSTWTERNSYDASAEPTKLTTGLPGMMHWLNDGSGSGGGDTYGWDQWSAQAA